MTRYDRQLCAALEARATLQGDVVLPCVPAACEYYLVRLGQLFAQLGKPLAEQELVKVRALLAQNLDEGYRRGSGTQMVVRYQITPSPTLQKNLGIHVSIQTPTLAEQFSAWAQRRGDAPFGAQPDARVWQVVDSLSAPPGAVLDVGGGTGRNALAIARRGHAVDVVELTEDFCTAIEQSAERERLPIRALRGDVLDPRTVIPAGKYVFALASEVVSHFRYGPNLRDFLLRMSESLQSGGWLLFNIFMPRPGYVPNLLACQMSEVAWATLFTYDQLAEALVGIPMRLVSDESVYDYERNHLPPSAWPPTPWFEAWSQGRSIFPLDADETPPVEMRWLLFERGSRTG